MSSALYEIAKLERIGKAICNQRRMAPRQPIAPVQTQYLPSPIDRSRPVQHHTVNGVAVLAQEGRSGGWCAWTAEPRACPGNEPVPIWGGGDTEADAVQQVAESIEVMARMVAF